MQELDITCIFSSCVMDREYNCTISGDDGFQTLRPMLNKVAPMTVAREGDTVDHRDRRHSRVHPPLYHHSDHQKAKEHSFPSVRRGFEDAFNQR